MGIPENPLGLKGTQVGASKDLYRDSSWQLRRTLTTRLHLEGVAIAHCGSRARRAPRPARCAGPNDLSFCASPRGSDWGFGISAPEFLRRCRLVFSPCGLEHAECRVESCPSIDIDVRNAAEIRVSIDRLIQESMLFEEVNVSSLLMKWMKS